MVITEGEKYGIGGIRYGENKEFTSHIFNYSQGDSFYTFTDGFADQFGGPNDRKMMKKNLFKLIGSAQSFDMKQQEKIIRHAFLEWKGENEQTDDVLLVGVRL
jgi:hypothetical protein